MTTSDFSLPDVGEGLTEAEIVSWRVNAGDTVTINHVLVEIETAKSLVELPSPFAGTVSALLVAEGETVDVGTPIITVGSSGEEPAAPAPEAVAAVADTKRPSRPRRSRAPCSSATAAAATVDPVAGGAPQAPAAVAPAATPRPASVPAAAASPIIAKPPIRKLAKDLGVDLADVTATGSRARSRATT